MTTMLALAPQHTFSHAPVLVHTVVSLALESLGDGRTIFDINIVLGMSSDVAQGRASVGHIMSYRPLDSLLCFGATYQSAGLPDKSPSLTPLEVLFPQQTQPVLVVCLPPVLSNVWHSTQTMYEAAEAVAALLLPDSINPAISLAIKNRHLN